MNANIIPIPTKGCLSGEGVCAPDFSGIRADLLLTPAINAAKDYAERLGLCGDKPVTLRYDAGIPAEGYRLTVTPDGCTASASDIPGAHHALAALLQAASAGKLPCGEIFSAPDCDYRGVMIDLARNWHPFSFLKEYVDMCWLYGIETLHLHFTDDQSYTLPSAVFPMISTEGRHYTFEEIAELDRYAAERGVQIMPEIDVPGHCTSHQKNYGDVFGTNGIIAQTKTSMDAMQALFTELCGMFPHSRRIHVGGDEAAILRWTEDEANRDYALSCGIDFDMEDKTYLSERLLANFVQKMADAVLACGRTPVAWEGFRKCVNQYISRKVLMMSWENYYQTTLELLDADFRIVNAAWKPMYVVTPNAYWSKEEVYGWSVYRWMAVHPQSPYRNTCLEIEPDERVRGGQLLAWGDSIASSFPTVLEGIREEQRLVEERAAILAEHTWNRRASLSAEEFLPIADNTFALLQKLKG